MLVRKHESELYTCILSSDITVVKIVYKMKLTLAVNTKATESVKDCLIMYIRLNHITILLNQYYI